MSFNGKHLSLEDRKIIEENINKGLRKFETAKELNKSQSTIGKEIKNNRKRRCSQAEDVPRKCKYYNECKVCIGMCSNFEEVPCLRRDKFVGACNSCPEINTEAGEIRSNIFYCDAQMPSQKPHVENNHEFIRDIILKKKDMLALT